MDGALSSSRDRDGAGGPSWQPPPGNFHSGSSGDRRDHHNRRDNRNPRRGGGRGYRGGGRGGYRGGGGGGGYRRGGGRGNWGGGRGGRGGRPYRQSNRFSTDGGGGRGGGGGPGSTSVDPQKAMMAQLSAMVAKLGDMAPAATATAAPATPATPDSPSAEGGGGGGDAAVDAAHAALRPDVGKNARELAAVLCSNNAELFLKFVPLDEAIKAASSPGGTAGDGDDDVRMENTAADDTGNDAGGDDDGEGDGANGVTVKVEKDDAASAAAAASGGDAATTISAEDLAGPTATLIVNCAATLPLQTGGYVALTAAIESMAPTSHKGFADRCVSLACQRMECDLELLLHGWHGVVGPKGGRVGGAGRSVLLPGEDVEVSDLVLLTGADGDDDDKDASKALKGNEKTRDVSAWDDAYRSRGAAMHRIKLLLRYLALLAKVGIVRLVDDNDGDENGASAANANDAHTTTLLTLLRRLADAAVTSSSTALTLQSTTASGTASRLRVAARRNDAKLLSYLVLSTMPHLLSMSSSDDANVNVRRVREECDAILSKLAGDVVRAPHMRSTYEPGRGTMALYLQKEEVDDLAEAEDDEEEDDEDDEDEGGDTAGGEDDGFSPGICCDTLQELLRVNQRLSACHWDMSAPVVREKKKSQDDGDDVEDEDDDDEDETEIVSCGAPGFVMFSDAPWEGLLPTKSDAVTTNEEDEAMEDDKDNGGEGQNEKGAPFEPVPLRLALSSLASITQHAGDAGNPPHAVAGDFGLGIGASSSSTMNGGDGSPHPSGVCSSGLLINTVPPSFVIAGRLPLLDDPDTSPNPSATRMLSTLTPSDRFFYSESIREVLRNHLPTVSGAGTELTSCREVAEQLAGLRCLFPARCHGEYVLVETMLGLLAQSSSVAGTGEVSPGIYLARVLLELCKLQPNTIPQAVAVGVGLVTAELSSLVPRARRALSEWFAFHLINTDFQWPYWSHWDACGTATGPARDAAQVRFVERVLRTCCDCFTPEYVASSKCLPPSSPLVSLLPNGGRTGFCSSLLLDVPNDEGSSQESALSCLARDARDKILQRQRPSEVAEWLCADESMNEEVAESTSLSMWRTVAAIHAVLLSAAIPPERDEDGDPLASTIDSITRYADLLSAAIAKDAESALPSAADSGEGSAVQGDDERESKVQEAEVCLLAEVQKIWRSSPQFVEMIIASLCKLEVVSLVSLTRWILLDSGDEGKGGPDLSSMTELWKLACDCVCDHVARGAREQQQGDASSMAISVDGEAGDQLLSEETALASKKLDSSLRQLAKVAEYSSRRVGQLLSEASVVANDNSSGGAVGKGKMSPRAVSIIEGLKDMVFRLQISSLELCFLMNATTSANLDTAADSLCGQKLGGLLQAFEPSGGPSGDQLLRIVASFLKCSWGGLPMT